jgi:hypothetical protein
MNLKETIPLKLEPLKKVGKERYVCSLHEGGNTHYIIDM